MGEWCAWLKGEYQKARATGALAWAAFRWLRWRVRRLGRGAQPGQASQPDEAELPLGYLEGFSLGHEIFPVPDVTSQGNQPDASRQSGFDRATYLG
jgi:hypothetical protein